ncbi:cinnamyl alcohol dehydrogenase 7 [Brassica napus]|uniref:cinnamyl alcohol dehydrogenase 7 n=1 Tax=Brassica napus TaxID=3708 RepID=UPI002079105E|nr:cinnamyl alcohol dehydrogenase 7 [Brassica napus]
MGEVLKKEAYGLAVKDESGVISPFRFSRRETGENDVRFKVLFCGICHTDLSMAINEWGFTSYPLVPGHEIVGVVTEVGAKVTKFNAGDKVGVGYMVSSCGSCETCTDDQENYCPKMILTSGGKYYDDTITYGGYSDHMVCEEDYIIRIPENLPLDATAPLLCAGTTVYSPMKYHGLDKPGMHIGVVGLGGLGHVAVKFAKAMGIKVTVISTSDRKRDEALTRLGADLFLVSRDPEQMKDAMGTMDGIIDTVSATHPVLPILNLLKYKGKLIMVGAPDKPLELPVLPLIFGKKMVVGSMVGGIKETQEMMDLAGKHNITADIELISADYVNTAMERLQKADVRYRFVIDVANTLKPSP